MKIQGQEVERGRSIPPLPRHYEEVYYYASLWILWGGKVPSQLMYAAFRGLLAECRKIRARGFGDKDRVAFELDLAD